MKKLLFNFSKLSIIIFSFIIFCNGCTTTDKNSIYQQEREWIFNVYFYNKVKKLMDTTEVKMSTKRFNWFSFPSRQRDLVFEYAGTKVRKSGLIEDEKRISLPFSDRGIFTFTKIIPGPSIDLPPYLITETSMESKIVKSVPSNKELDGQIISQKSRQMNETEEFEYNKEQLLCYKIEGWNTSHIEEFGQYKVTYWFNEKYGFTRLLYEKPDSSIVDIQLVRTNFD